MPVQTPVPIRLPGSFPPNVPQPCGYNSSPLPPPADYYVSRKELLEIVPDLGVMKSVPSAANDTVVLFDDKGQVKSSGVKLSDKADTETVETLVGEDGGKSAREIAKEEVNQLLGEDPNELYDTFTEVSEFIGEAKQNYQAINNALSEEVTRATQSEAQIDGKINTIIADDAGKSARTIAAEEVAKVVADAPADFDTLKEIAEYIESDKTGAAQMVTKIDANANAITAEAQRAQEAEAALREGKADKVANATSGNLASLDENGNLTDSGNAVAGVFAAESFLGGGSGGVGFQLGSPSEWVELYVNDGGGKILKFPLREGTLAVQDDIAPTFDETDAYYEGALVFHNGLYRCTNQSGHTGEWLEADFSRVTVKDVLADKADKVANATDGNLAAIDSNGNLTDSGMALRDFAVAESLAPVFVAGVAYEVGDLCTSFDNDEQHKGAWLYKCILATDGSQPTWPETDPTHWALATVEDLLAALRTAVAGKQDALSQEQVEAVNSGITAGKVSKLEGIEAGAQKNPDLSGYATKDAVLPRYYFTILEIVDGVVTVPPYTSASMPGDGTAFTVAVGEGNSMYLRDCILCVQCGDVAPTITWPANFHPRTDAETDFACVAGAMNVYWISEYAQGEFAVAGWQATAGGGAV